MRRCDAFRALFALASLALRSPAAFAGAPFQTDDPAVIDVGHADVLVFTQQTLAASGRNGVLAGAEIHYGLIQNLEFDLGIPYAFDSPTGGGEKRGYGDTTLGIKYRLIRESDVMPLISLVPKVNLPTGNSNEGLGNGGSQIFLGLALQKSNGNFLINGDGGYWINNGPGNRNYGFLGLQAQYSLGDHWQLGLEIFHTSPQEVGQGARTGVNVGGYYLFDKKNQILFSVGKGVQNAAETNRVSSYLGYQASF